MSKLKYHIVYQLTDSLTGKIYIGSITTNLENFKSYKGSGTALMAEYRKRKSTKDFDKKIIVFCESKQHRLELENYLIFTSKAYLSEVGYNLKCSLLTLDILTPKELFDFILKRERKQPKDLNRYNSAIDTDLSRFLKTSNRVVKRIRPLVDEILEKKRIERNQENYDYWRNENNTLLT